MPPAYTLMPFKTFAFFFHICYTFMGDFMRNVVITGGSRGIGAACAEVFSQNGDRVFIIYEKNDACAALVAEKTGAIPVKADISCEADVKKAADTIHTICGGVDVLVNNAGIAEIKVFNDITAADWDRIFSVNVKGAFLMTKAFLSDMINKKSGKIINVSSIWGQTGGSCEVHYSASKAALIGFTKALAKQLAPSGICVNCIAPGVIETEMNVALDEETMEALCEEIPSGRIGTPIETAKTALFLASDAASYITGQVLAVNGGMYI